MASVGAVYPPPRSGDKLSTRVQPFAIVRHDARYCSRSSGVNRGESRSVPGVMWFSFAPYRCRTTFAKFKRERPLLWAIRLRTARMSAIALACALQTLAADHQGPGRTGSRR